MLTVVVPSNLRMLRIDSDSGTVSVSDFDGQLTIAMGKGAVAVSQISGPALIENRDGKVSAIITVSNVAPAATLKASLNILARNGDIDLLFPGGMHATLDAEAHRGSIVDAPLMASIWPGSGDTLLMKTHPALGLQDSELRNLHRDFNGGGPQIKLITLNGNVTLADLLPGLQSARDAHAPYSDEVPKPPRT
jgi:hypothetical protein